MSVPSQATIILNPKKPQLIPRAPQHCCRPSTFGPPSDRVYRRPRTPARADINDDGQPSTADRIAVARNKDNDIGDCVIDLDQRECVVPVSYERRTFAWGAHNDLQSRTAFAFASDR